MKFFQDVYEKALEKLQLLQYQSDINSEEEPVHGKRRTRRTLSFHYENEKTDSRCMAHQSNARAACRVSPLSMGERVSAELIVAAIVFCRGRHHSERAGEPVPYCPEQVHESKHIIRVGGCVWGVIVIVTEAFLYARFVVVSRACSAMPCNCCVPLCDSKH